MDLKALAESLNPRLEEGLRLHRCWPWFVALGVLLMVVGAMAVGAPFLSTLSTVEVFGALLLAAGVVQLVNAFLARGWKAFFLHLLAGSLHLVVGVLLIDQPVAAAAGLTLLLAAAFLVGGVGRLVYALFEDFTGRGWVALNGAVTLLLGVLIWRQWPASSLYVIGLFVGIDLLFAGWSWVMLGLVVKAATPAVPPPAAANLPEPVGAGRN